MLRCSSDWILGTAMDTIVWSMNVIATAKIIAVRTRTFLSPLPLATVAVTGRSPRVFVSRVCWSAAQVAGQERHRLGHRVGAVGPIGQAVALVAVDQQLAFLAPAGQGGVDLLGLAERHPRVVSAMD